MYPRPEIISAQEQIAERFVIDNDRMQYVAFFEETERFCSKNKILLGGAVGIDLIVGNPITKDSFYWELYCADTFNMAKNLAVALAGVNSPHVPAETTSMQTRLRHKEFDIFINARPFIKLISLEVGREKLSVEPEMRKALFTGVTLGCMPRELQLIQVYRILYTPAMASAWKGTLRNESKLRIKTVAGQGSEGPDSEFISLVHGDRVLIGGYALRKLGIFPSNARLQFITSDDISTVIAECKGLVRKAERVSFTTASIKVPDDFQTAKYIIRATDGKSERIIAEVYDSSAFEMIPFQEVEGLKLGSPWVILRFMYINIWSLRVTRANFSKMASHLEDCNMFRNQVDVATAFYIEDYVGNYHDPRVEKSKLVKQQTEAGFRFRTYYPARATMSADGAIKTAGADVTERDILGEDSSSDEEVIQARTPALIPALMPQSGSIVSRPINLAADTPAMRAILRKITGMNSGELIDIITAHANKPSDYTKWGVNKSLDKYFQKNRQFLPFMPRAIDTYVDVGCGDGLDLAAVQNRYSVRNAICADIDDFRDSKYKKYSTFTKVSLDDPLQIADGAADVVTMFHSIHHMQDDVAARIRDIGRITRHGGVVFLKDHNVSTWAQAANVDFEHFVYMLPDWKHDIQGLMDDFGKYEPIKYYAADVIERMFSAAGMKRIWYNEVSPITFTYAAIYKKI